MSFISIHYIVFLVICFSIYWAIEDKNRWMVILAGSYYFYASWSIEYLSLIVIVTIISFWGALLIEDDAYSNLNRKVVRNLCIVVCLSILFVFKYLKFSVGILELLYPESTGLIQGTVFERIVLPVGISFYTFQSISYVIDVYRGSVPAEKNIKYYATYIILFPQLVAGPIERPGNLLPQLKQVKSFSATLASDGLKRILWGGYKKVVIADTLAVYTDLVFDKVTQYSGFALLLASLAFTFQIYCDFSGYSDIAIGSAELFGIKLRENFKAPYFSTSLREFWQRWHISLSSWFRDYVYIPLGGNKKGALRKNINQLITFTLSGLWHGANITFVLWGFMHGIAQVAENCLIANTRRFQSKNVILKAFDILMVFVFCSFAWIFFRAETISDAFYVVGHMFDGITDAYDYVITGVKTFYGSISYCFFVPVSLLVLFLWDADVIHGIHKLFIRIRLFRWLFFWGLALWIVFAWINNGADNPFVYFQF